MSESQFKTSRGVVLMTVQVQGDVLTSPSILAAAFCEMDAEQQAQFFADVDRVMQTWKDGAGAPMQRYHIAQALKGDGMDGARHWIADLVDDVGERL
jgi:hypothetical protein